MKRDGPISSPLSEVPSPQSGSVPRKFGTFFFNQWGNGGRGLLRELRRGKTDTDRDRDRTGDNGSHREPEKERERETLGGGVGSGWANGKEQGDNSMQQTLTKHLLGGEEQGARRPLRVSEI